MDNQKKCFQDNFAYLLAKRGLSPENFAELKGYSKNTVRGWLNKKRPDTLPRADDLLGVSEFFGLPPKVLLYLDLTKDDERLKLNAYTTVFQSAAPLLSRNVSSIGTNKLDFLDVLKWYWRGNENFWSNEKIEDKFVIYDDPVIHQKIVVRHVGIDSLAAKELGTKSVDMLQAVIDGLSAKAYERLFNDCMECRNVGPTLAIEEIQVNHPNESRVIDFAYARLMVPALDNGATRLLNYSVSLD